MDYYKLLQLECEPFSNSPDPDYFFQSRQHTDCLHRLELALRLKRGLNVVIGEVGTGKTTLCRELIRRFADQTEIETHLILDPAFDTPAELLTAVYEMIVCPQPTTHPNAAEIKEKIKQALFSKGIDQNRTVVLVVDEGQKISSGCIELLRELLNFETNTYKLLQIVIFAQPEFESILRSHANFADRINLLHHLRPLDFRDTRQMIMYRLKLASRDVRPRQLFTLPALWSIYRASQGYPRRIVNLCHQSVLAMIIQNRTRAGWRLIRSCRNRLQPIGRRSRVLLWVAAALIIGMGGSAALYGQWNHLTTGAALQRFKVPSQEATAERLPPTLDIEPQKTDTNNGEPPIFTSQTEISAAPLPQSRRDAPTLIQDLTAPSSASADIAPAPIFPAALPPEPLYPRELGTVTVQPGDTLVSLVRKVYGGYRHHLLRAVIEANPIILDPNTIETGDPLVFPAIRFTSPRRTGSAEGWIILKQCGSLSEALAFKSELEKQWNLPARMLTYWTATEGLRFHVALPEPFADRNEAQARIEGLPAMAAAAAHTSGAWLEDIHLYSIVPIAMASDAQ
jgi:general secretion pathway protein A